MNCLVLGGNGFIGSHLVDKLLAEGHSVRVFDKYEEHYRKPLIAVDYCYGDFGNRGLLMEALTDMDMVIHLISMTLPKSRMMTLPLMCSPILSKRCFYWNSVLHGK